MKALLMLFFISMTSFAPATQQPIAVNHLAADPYPCRTAFILNYGATVAVIEVQGCDGTSTEYTLLPGEYVSTGCLSTAFGAVVVEGNVVVDWGASCS